VTAVTKETEEYTEVEREFHAGCASYATKYDFKLELKAIYRVDRGDVEADPATTVKLLSRTVSGRRLFHGTKLANAQHIVKDGFKLPSHAGMFGRGVYFADCPLKSFQYTDGGGQRNTTGTILVCWVELGRPSEHTAAKTSLKRPPHRTFMQFLKRQERFGSVVGTDQAHGGSLRVPEYIVYDTKKVEVDYILEVAGLPPRG